MVKLPALSPAYCVLVRTMSAKGYLLHNGGILFSFPEATRADFSEEAVRRQSEAKTMIRHFGAFCIGVALMRCSRPQSLSRLANHFPLNAVTAGMDI